MAYHDIAIPEFQMMALCHQWKGGKNTLLSHFLAHVPTAEKHILRNNLNLQVHLYCIYYSKLPVGLYSRKGTLSLTDVCVTKSMIIR